MNSRTARILALAALTAGSVAYGQVFTSSPFLAIPDSSGPSVQDTITVSGGPTSITALAVTINITHTYTGDLDIVLVFNGQTLHLTTDSGGSGDNFIDTRFIDSAVTSISAGVAPFTGDFRPEGGTPGWTGTIVIPTTYLANLAGFNGQDSNGAWDLVIDDDLGGDTGTLNSWQIDFNPTLPLGAVGSYAGCVTPADGGTAIMRVTVSPGNNPPSTGVSVTLDGSAVGLASNIVLLDDGLNGDGAAGDNVYGAVRSIEAGYSTGNYPLPFTVTDAESRTATGNVTVAVANAASVYSSGSSLPATAEIPSGSGSLTQIDGVFDAANEANMYLIEICDPASFSATTYLGTTLDTQLFLFRADGTGVAANDDVPDGQPGDATLQSRLSNALVTAPGNYYLAVSRYNHDPVSNGCGALIFPNTPFNIEHPANAGAGPVFAWSGAVASSTTPYSIFLTGVCYPNGGPTCDPDFNQDGNVDQDDIACLAQVVGGDPTCSAADPDFNRDGNVDQDDIMSLEQVVGGANCP